MTLTFSTIDFHFLQAKFTVFHRITVSRPVTIVATIPRVITLLIILQITLQLNYQLLMYLTQGYLRNMFRVNH